MQVLILGIGNLLWADEGFGVRAVEELHRRYEFPEKWVSPSLTLAWGSAEYHGFFRDRAIGGGVDGDRLLGKAVEEEPTHLW